jgi:hypothetical protein
MPRLTNDPGRRDSSAQPSDDEIAVAIAKLFTSRPPATHELFADPVVRMRIGMLIARAINEPRKPRAGSKSR